MGWIKRANGYGIYRSSYCGFRIYRRRAGVKGDYPLIAVNNRGQIAEGQNIEHIGFEIDKITLLNYLDAKDAKQCAKRS